jgi:toxin secretion/phage lysis holin
MIYSWIETSLKWFIVVVIIDYITGVLKSIYTKKISSNIGYKGIIKKIGMISFIILFKVVDYLKIFDIDFSNMILIFFVSNEIISIMENLSAINLDLPLQIKKYFKKK